MAVTLPLKLFAEYLGTFLLMLTVLATGGNPLLIGSALALIVFATGGISGAAVNPAISLGLWSIGSLDALSLVWYVLIQLGAGVSAAWVYKAVA